MKTIISALTSILCIAAGTGISGNYSAVVTVTPDAVVSEEKIFFEPSAEESEDEVCEMSAERQNDETDFCETDEDCLSYEEVSDISEDSDAELQYEIPEAAGTDEYFCSEDCVSCDEKEMYYDFSPEFNEESGEPEYFEYQVLYKELLNELRYDTEGVSSVMYFLFDMNEDDVPELITVTGTCEADKTASFYTIKNHETVIIGENFRGDHCTFCVDKRTGLFVMKNEWCGLGSVTGYVFDGDTVCESTALYNYNYMHNPEGYDFVTGELYDVYVPEHGIAYHDGESIFVTCGHENVILNESSYYFTD